MANHSFLKAMTITTHTQTATLSFWLTPILSSYAQGLFSQHDLSNVTERTTGEPQTPFLTSASEDQAAAAGSISLYLSRLEDLSRVTAWVFKETKNQKTKKCPHTFCSQRIFFHSDRCGAVCKGLSRFSALQVSQYGPAGAAGGGTCV